MTLLRWVQNAETKAEIGAGMARSSIFNAKSQKICSFPVQTNLTGFYRFFFALVFVPTLSGIIRKRPVRQDRQTGLGIRITGSKSATDGSVPPLRNPCANIVPIILSLAFMQQKSILLLLQPIYFHITSLQESFQCCRSSFRLTP